MSVLTLSWLFWSWFMGGKYVTLLADTFLHMWKVQWFTIRIKNKEVFRFCVFQNRDLVPGLCQVDTYRNPPNHGSDLPYWSHRPDQTRPGPWLISVKPEDIRLRFSQVDSPLPQPGVISSVISSCPLFLPLIGKTLLSSAEGLIGVTQYLGRKLPQPQTTKHDSWKEGFIFCRWEYKICY
jgi:hypothetical protein